MSIERTWIQQLQRRWPHAGIGHDAFYDPNSRLILTTDMLVEGVHFSWHYASPQDVGWRSMAVNLSDIAATGGKPAWAVVSIGIAPNSTLELLDQIYEGIDACRNQYQFTLVGGDTVRANKTTISVTILGQLDNHAKPGRRNTAIPGHVIAVSGSHGLSRAGLYALENKLSGFLEAKKAHLRPIPQLKLGQSIAQVVPDYAMMDTSDGLADGLTRLAEASNVDIIVDPNLLDVHTDVEQLAHQAEAKPLDWILYGGEDFHLIVSLPPETMSLFPELKAIGRVSAPAVSGKGQARLVQGDKLVALDLDKTFQHFPQEIVKTADKVIP